MLDSLPADARPARGDGQDLAAARRSARSEDKFPPATRLLIVVGGAAASWALVAALVWLAERAI